MPEPVLFDFHQTIRAGIMELLLLMLWFLGAFQPKLAIALFPPLALVLRRAGRLGLDAHGAHLPIVGELVPLFAISVTVLVVSDGAQEKLFG